MAPRRSLLAFLIFAALFYLLPLHAVLRDAYQPLACRLPTLGLAGLPPVLDVEVSLHYVLATILFYALTFALVALGLRLLQAYHCDAARRWLGRVTSIKGLAGTDRLIRHVAALVALGAAAASPFRATEGLAVLAGLAWFSLVANRASQPAGRDGTTPPRPHRFL